MKAAKFFPAYTPFIIRHRYLVIVLVSLVTVSLLVGIKALHVQVEPHADLPQDHPYVIADNDIEREFGGRNLVVVGIEDVHGNIFNTNTINAIKRVTEQISLIPGVIPSRIQSIWASRTKDIYGTAEGISARPLLENPPLTDDDLDHLQQRIHANPIYVDSLISHDGSAAFVIADFRLEEAGGYRQILKQVQLELDTIRSPDIRFHLGGQAINLAWLEIYSERMQQWFLVVLAVVMVVSYLTFGTFQATFIPLLTGIVSVLWTLGIMGWLNIPMDMYNVATPILIMTVGHGHSVQILKRYYEELQHCANRNEAISRALAAVGPVMITASGIAILSFLALLVFPLKTIRVFGVMAAVGIAAALILELSLIPALRSILRSTAIGSKRALPGYVDPLMMVSRFASQVVAKGRSKAVLFLTGSLLLVAVGGAIQVTVDNSLKGNFSANSELRKDDGFINEHSGGASTLYFIVEGKSDDAMKDPRVLRGIEQIQDRLQGSFRLIGKTQSIVDYLKKMNLAMHGDDHAFNTVPETQELAAQYLLLYSLSGDPGDFDLFVDYGYRSALIWTFLKTDSTANAEQVINAVKDWSQELFPSDVQVRFGGSVAQAVALNQVMVHGKLVNLVMIGACVFLLASLVLGSFLGGALVLVPLVLTVLANFGVMGWLGIRLDVATAVISALGVGVGADYAIYLLARIREELGERKWEIALKKGVESAGKAVISVALAVGSGYAVLLLSGFHAHMRLGGLVAVAMTVSCASAIFVLPVLLNLMQPAFLCRSPSAKRSGLQLRLCL